MLAGWIGTSTQPKKLNLGKAVKLKSKQETARSAHRK
jgi:hypothetical protein